MAQARLRASTESSAAAWNAVKSMTKQRTEVGAGKPRRQPVNVSLKACVTLHLAGILHTLNRAAAGLREACRRNFYSLSSCRGALALCVNRLKPIMPRWDFFRRIQEGIPMRAKVGLGLVAVMLLAFGLMASSSLLIPPAVEAQQPPSVKPPLSVEREAPPPPFVVPPPPGVKEPPPPSKELPPSVVKEPPPQPSPATATPVPPARVQTPASTSPAQICSGTFYHVRDADL